MSDKKKIVIIGGVAGGASAAARIRRLSEDAEITMYEKSGHVSFANCGLPYHIGGTIKDRSNLLVQTPKGFKSVYNIDAKVNTEVTSIDRDNKKITARTKDGEELTQDYDYLILSPGAEPIKPPIPGIESKGVFTLRNIEDMDSIIKHINENSIDSAVVVGGGYIGLEMTEALIEKGLKVSLVEMADQVFGPLDKEMTGPINQQLLLHGVNMKLGSQLTEIKTENDELQAVLKDGEPINAGIIILAIGVKPSVKLAKDCGLEIGERGGIKVNSRMQTSDESIYAVGDAVEVKDFVAGFDTLVPLAGPANRQGRIVADNIFGRDSEYKDTQGTAICKIFDTSAAMTGLSEKVLKARGIEYKKIYLHPNNHAGYYPGAAMLAMKLLFDGKTGKIFGAQAVGSDGVDKRIDVIAVAIRAGLTVADLENLELSYAPPYGSAKDPINYAGFIANNVIKGDLKVYYVEELENMSEDQVLLDVRSKAEFEAGAVKGATLIPLNELRSRLGELDKSKEYIVYCRVGARAYHACRILEQNGFNAKNLTGGYLTYRNFMDSQNTTPTGQSCLMSKTCSSEKKGETDMPQAEIKLEIDACGLQCPGPAMKLKEGISKLQDGECMAIETTDGGFAADAGAWCDSTGNELLDLKSVGGKFRAVIRKGAGRIKTDATTVKTGKKTMVVFDGNFDKAMASFIIANGAAAAGSEVTMFFTFWGITLLRKKNPPKIEKNIIEKMFGFMLPKGAERAPLSRMNFLGGGLAMIKGIMRSKNVASITELIDSAKKNGVRLVVCNMSMDLMGIREEELIDGLEFGGVALYLNEAEKSDTNLFI